MAGEGGSRTHLSTCIDKLVLKTSRATGPYPLPLSTYQAITGLILLTFANDDDCPYGR